MLHFLLSTNLLNFFAPILVTREFKLLKQLRIIEALCFGYILVGNTNKEKK
jgi:hypothetical protein